MSVLHAARAALYACGALVCGAYGALSWLRGPRRRLPVDPREVRRILVIRLDLLGDVVFSIPALEALRAAYPAARIDALALPYTAPVLRQLPVVSTVHELDVNRFRRPAGWRDVGRLVAVVRCLRASRYDVAVALSGLMGGVCAAVSGARWRVGYGEETYRGALNCPVPGRRYRRRQHESEYCLDLVRALGGWQQEPERQAAVQPRLPISSRAAGAPGASGEEWSAPGGLGEPGRPSPRTLPTRYAVLVPGASNGAAKRWPAPHWAALGDALAAERGLATVLVGAASERELGAAITTAMQSPACNLTGATSIDELIGVLAGAAVVIAGDTGPLHLAAALGTPVVGLYGPTDPDNTGPRGAQSASLRVGLRCSPCYDLRQPAACRLPDRSMPCMWRLTPRRVLAAVAALLDAPREGAVQQGH